MFDVQNCIIAHSAAQTEISAPGYNGSNSSGSPSFDGTCVGEDPVACVGVAVGEPRLVGDPVGDDRHDRDAVGDAVGDGRPDGDAVGDVAGDGRPDGDAVGDVAGDGRPNGELWLGDDPVGERRSFRDAVGELRLVGELLGEFRTESENDGEPRPVEDREHDLGMEQLKFERSPGGAMIGRPSSALRLRYLHKVARGIGAVESLRYFLYCPLVLMGVSPDEAITRTETTVRTVCYTATQCALFRIESRGRRAQLYVHVTRMRVRARNARAHMRRYAHAHMRTHTRA